MQFWLIFINYLSHLIFFIKWTHFFMKSAKNGIFFMSMNILINGRIYTPGNVFYKGLVELLLAATSSPLWFLKKFSFLLLDGGIDSLLLRPPPRPITRPIPSCLTILAFQCLLRPTVLPPCTARPFCRSCTSPHCSSFQYRNSIEEIW